MPLPPIARADFNAFVGETCLSEYACLFELVDSKGTKGFVQKQLFWQMRTVIAIHLDDDGEPLVWSRDGVRRALFSRTDDLGLHIGCSLQRSKACKGEVTPEQDYLEGDLVLDALLKSAFRHDQEGSGVIQQLLAEGWITPQTEVPEPGFSALDALTIDGFQLRWDRHRFSLFTACLVLGGQEGRSKWRTLAEDMVVKSSYFQASRCRHVVGDSVQWPAFAIALSTGDMQMAGFVQKADGAGISIEVLKDEQHVSVIPSLASCQEVNAEGSPFERVLRCLTADRVVHGKLLSAASDELKARFAALEAEDTDRFPLYAETLRSALALDFVKEDKSEELALLIDRLGLDPSILHFGLIPGEASRGQNSSRPSELLIWAIRYGAIKSLVVLRERNIRVNLPNRPLQGEVSQFQVGDWESSGFPILSAAILAGINRGSLAAFRELLCFSGIDLSVELGSYSIANLTKSWGSPAANALQQFALSLVNQFREDPSSIDRTAELPDAGYSMPLLPLWSPFSAAMVAAYSDSEEDWG